MNDNNTHPYKLLLQELDNIEQLKTDNPEQYQALYTELLGTVETYRNTLKDIVKKVESEQ